MLVLSLRTHVRIGLVRAVLEAARNELIGRHLERLETEFAETRAAVDALRNLLERPAASADVEHRTVPPVPAIGIQQVVDREDILSWW